MGSFVPFGMRHENGRSDTFGVDPKKDNRPGAILAPGERALSLRDNFSKGRIGHHGRLQSGQHGHRRLFTGCDECSVLFLG